MQIKATADLWWKNAVIYCLDVETFLDGNGDGYGDFAGLIQHIDYLAGMGVTCLWLMPFYPTPDRDDGYDVIDYYSVNPRLGDLGDFVDFMRVATDRGIRVIVDLVVNHTSDRHPWFQAARRSRNSPYRDYYVWRDEVPEGEVDGIVFPDAEHSNWAWDEAAGQYYLHRFYTHQPDLNIANPAVRDEITKIIGFWMQLGIAGFRVDAVPYLLETEGIKGEVDIVPHDCLRDLRAFLGRRRGDAILIGEVNLKPRRQRRFFGDEDGDELHMVFNFYLNQKLYLALVRERAGPLRQALRALPEIPPENQWANFVKNHDEQTLDQLTDRERREVFAAFAPDEDMRLFGRGIRRRLPSMVEGDPRRLRLAYSLLFSLPGTPVLFYGEEIGMAENPAIDGRLAVRTPMQWTGEDNGGFSTAPPGKLCRPLVDDPRFAPAAVNVADQRRDSDSLLNWMERLIRRRKECPEIGLGECRLMDTARPAVFAHRCDWHGSTVIAVHNLSAAPQRVTLALDDAAEIEELLDLLGHRDCRPQPDGTLPLELDGYDYCWLRAHRAGRPRLP
ncbi:MAG: alpha-amylase family protein [Pseudomonadota bacterium]|nr:alpha-amylase family protein [Pseudomonadota bacterium]